MAVMRTLIASAALALLSGCVPPADDSRPAMPDEGSDACKASTYQGLVGQPRAVADRMQLPDGTRIIGPSDAVTMDYRIDRLNIEIGKGGRIARIACY